MKDNRLAFGYVEFNEPKMDKKKHLRCQDYEMVVTF